MNRPISTEDFSAAVDYLTSHEDVDLEYIAATGCSANEPQKESPVTPTVEKP